MWVTGTLRVPGPCGWPGSRGRDGNPVHRGGRGVRGGGVGVVRDRAARGRNAVRPGRAAAVRAGWRLPDRAGASCHGDSRRRAVLTLRRRGPAGPARASQASLPAAWPAGSWSSTVITPPGMTGGGQSRPSLPGWLPGTGPATRTASGPAAGQPTGCSDGCLSGGPVPPGPATGEGEVTAQVIAAAARECGLSPRDPLAAVAVTPGPGARAAGGTRGPAAGGAGAA